MDSIKTLAISSGFVALLLGFLPILQSRVAADQAVNNSTFQLTNDLATSVIQLSPFAILAIAAAAILGALRVLS
jgi:hypothetical protein